MVSEPVAAWAKRPFWEWFFLNNPFAGSPNLVGGFSPPTPLKYGDYMV